MKVRRVHPDQILEERKEALLVMSYEERLLRHKELLKKIYPGKVDLVEGGLKVYKKRFE